MNYNLDPQPRECDINGLHEHQADNEGNRVHPVFSTDEWYDHGDTENPIQHMVCGDCHKIIDTYEHNFSDVWKSSALINTDNIKNIPADLMNRLLEL